MPSAIDDEILDLKIKLQKQQLAQKLTQSTAAPARVDPTLATRDARAAVNYAAQQKQEQELIASGVDIRSGAPVGRFGVGFAANEDSAKQYLQSTLTEHFKDSLQEGQRVNIRTGPKSKQIEFMNPKTKQWTTFDESGLTMRDIQDMAGPALPFIGEVVGAIAGGTSGVASGPGAIAMAAGGALAGGTAGESGRLAIGKAMGVNPDISGEDILEQGVGEGARAAAGEVIGEGVFRGGRYLLGKRTPFNVDQAQALVRESQSSQEVIDEINDRVRGEFNPTLGQRTGNQAVLDREASLRGGVDLVDTDEVFRKIEVGNRGELEKFFEVISPEGQAGKVTTGKGVKSQFAQSEREGLDQARQVDQSTRELISVEAEDIRRLDAPLAGKDIREGLESLRANAEELETSLWSDVKERAGFNSETASSSVKIPRGGDLDSTVRTLSTEAKKALSEGEARGKSSLISRLVQKDEDTIKILDHNGKVLSEISTSGRDIDLVQMNSTISQLRRQIRVSSKGLNADDPSVGDAKRLLKSLVTTRNEHLSKTNPELLAAIQDAEHATRTTNRIFTRGVSSKFLRETDDGDFVIDNAGVFNQIFVRNNAQAAHELASVLNANPQAIQKTREHIFSLYKKSVFQDGVPDPKLHRKFMDEFEDVIAPFFRKGDMDRVKKFGRFGDIVQRRAKEMEDLEKAFNSRLPGKIKKLNSESIVDSVFGRGKTEGGAATLNLEDVKKLRRTLEVGPEGLLDDTQRVFRDEISRRIRTDGVLDSKKLGALLDDFGDKVSVLGGPQYRADLKKLHAALKMVDSRGVKVTKGEEPALIQFLRSSVLRPLSRAQRRITFGSKLNLSHRESALLEAVTDPDKLHALTINMNKKIGAKNVAGILGMLELTDSAEPLIEGNLLDKDQ